MTQQDRAEEPSWSLPKPVLVPGWVIEHPNSDPARPTFLTTDGTPSPWGWRWTAELDQALRFGRRTDEQLLAGAKGYLHARLVERHFPAGR